MTKWFGNWTLFALICAGTAHASVDKCAQAIADAANEDDYIGIVQAFSKTPKPLSEDDRTTIADALKQRSREDAAFEAGLRDAYREVLYDRLPSMLVQLEILPEAIWMLDEFLSADIISWVLSLQKAPETRRAMAVYKIFLDFSKRPWLIHEWAEVTAHPDRTNVILSEILEVVERIDVRAWDFEEQCEVAAKHISRVLEHHGIWQDGSSLMGVNPRVKSRETILAWTEILEHELHPTKHR